MTQRPPPSVKDAQPTMCCTDLSPWVRPDTVREVQLDPEGRVLSDTGPSHPGLAPLPIPALGEQVQWDALPTLHRLVKQARVGEGNTARLRHQGRDYTVWVQPELDLQGLSGIRVLFILAEGLDDEPDEAQILARYTTDLITVYDQDGRCRYASPAAERILGRAPHTLIGLTLDEILDSLNVGRNRKRLFAKLAESDGENWISHEAQREDGRPLWLETRARIETDPDGERVTRIVAISRDITQRRETEERLTYLANYDSLTGLPNRTLFRDRLRRAIARAQRNGTKVALLFLDLDRFKNINDSLGHHAGDQLLRGMARRLQKHAREGDTVARLGGDEFTVILEGIKDPEDAAAVARKILELMETPFRLDGHEIIVSTSIGITLFPDDAQDMRTLLKNADTAMYRTKEKGRNNYHFYTADMNAKAVEHLMLENSLRFAIDRQEFLLYYQPQVDLHSRRIIGVEALLRWMHPEQGLIEPDRFIPFAEETQLIIPIGEWVLRNACRQAKAWEEAGLPPMRMAVNLSMQQFRQPDFVAVVRSALDESGLDPTHLELEITEGFLAHNIEKTAQMLHELKDLGVNLSIDDFGTGFSSLNYLRKFPLKKLKIDQSFVRDITTNTDDANIAEAIIALGKSLQLEVVAEGVEEEGQLYFLRTHGCDQVQGFLVSHPLPAEELTPLLREYSDASAPRYEQYRLWPELLAT